MHLAADNRAASQLDQVGRRAAIGAEAMRVPAQHDGFGERRQMLGDQTDHGDLEPQIGGFRSLRALSVAAAGSSPGQTRRPVHQSEENRLACSSKGARGASPRRKQRGRIFRPRLSARRVRRRSDKIRRAHRARGYHGAASSVRRMIDATPCSRDKAGDRDQGRGGTAARQCVRLLSAAFRAAAR